MNLLFAQPRLQVPRTMARAFAVIVCVTLTVLSTSSLARGHRPQHTHIVGFLPARDASPDALVVRSLVEIRGGQLDTAWRHIEAALKLSPNFRLAHLIRGDLLLARARPLTTLGDAPLGDADSLHDLREEARLRLAGFIEPPPPGKVPKYLLELQEGQTHAVVVDASRARVYVFRHVNGEFQLVKDYYASIGKNGVDKAREGDRKTPLGVYFVNHRLPGRKLTDFYGSGAFPISYPNEWDRRMGRNGHGIWLHGTPRDTYSRPPRASDGCVVLTNDDLRELTSVLRGGATPVVITDNVEWADAEETRSRRQALRRSLDTWRQDWEGRDPDRFLAHYSRDFRSDDENLEQWTVRKRTTVGAKNWIRVEVSHVSMFLYPGTDDLALITFDQDYRSDRLDHRMRKRQYWRFENDQWRIVGEYAV